MAIVKFVPHLGCVSQDSEALVSQSGKQSRRKPDARSLGIKSKSTVHSVHATSGKYPGKERTLAWKNTSHKSSSAKSLRYKNLRTDLRKRLKDNSDAPEARHGTLQKHIQAQRKDKTTFHSPAEEWVQRKSQRKDSLW